MTIHVIQPKSNDDRQSIYQLLYKIWSGEFCRSIEGINHEHRLVQDALDETAQHFMAVDQSGEILGCLRINILSKTVLPLKIQKHLKTAELIELFGADKTYYVSHFAVDPDARGRTVASLLIGALYRYCLNEGALVGTSYCALHYIAFYYQLGYRPYADNFRLDAGVRVPIIYCARDLSYLNEIRSPLAKLCSREFDDGGATADKLSRQFPDFKNPVFSRKKINHLWARLAHTMPNDPKMRDNIFFSSLTEEEQRLVDRWASEISFFQGEYVYQRAENEEGMGVLLSGSLGVEMSLGGVSRIINVILPGEPFGEIHCLGGGGRTVDLVALETSLAFLLPTDFLERINHANSKLGLKLANRLLKTLANRFNNLSNVAIQNFNNNPTTVQIKQNPLPEPLDTNEINSRIESYRFESLGDQEGEFKRLVTQATIGEKLEFSMLDNAGLRDGAKVLDLGSGPGVTSLLVAKHLPLTTVIGVEPEDLLRAKAESLIASQGFSKRCQFLRGIGDQIPLDDGAVDFSYARFLFQHLVNPLAVLSEMRRVTRIGGIIVVLDVDDSTNIVHPAPEGFTDLEKRIGSAQAAAGGDRHVGRKLFGFMHSTGLQEVSVKPVPITTSALGRQEFFSTVYSFKRQVLEREGALDEQTSTLFSVLENLISNPTTFAMTTVYVARGVVP